MHFGFNISRTFETGNHKEKKLKKLKKEDKL